MSTVNEWPGISVSKKSSEIIEKLKAYPGFFEGLESRSILQIAAAYAMSNGVKDEINFSRDSLQTHPSLLSGEGYQKDRTFICLTFYTLKKPALENMNDKLMMVKFYESIAQQGLSLLETDYLNSNRIKDLGFIQELIDSIK